MTEFPHSKDELREAAMLAWIHDFAPYGVISTDRDFRILSWNRWMEVRSGKPSGGVLGRIIFELFPDLVERGLANRFKRALDGEVSVLSTALHGYLLRLDFSIPEAAFEQMQQTARIAPLAFEKEIIGTVVVIEDVTQREVQALLLRRQHERERLLSWALAHLLESREPRRGIRELFCKIAEQFDFDAYLLYLIGPDGMTLKLHAAGGISAEIEARISVLEPSNPLAALFLESGTAQAREPIQLTASGTVLLANELGFRACALLPLSTPEGSVGTLCFGARTRTTLQEGELDLLSTIAKYLAVALLKEATNLELNAAQAKLSQHAQELEKQVSERTAKLRDIIAELETYSYTLAHDLRAPIRALIGYSDVLLEDYSSLLPEDGKSIIKRLSAACKQLDGLTKDLLEFSKVSREDIILGPVDIDEIVAGVISLLPAASTNTVVRKPLHWVLAHRGLLRQCISNLIDNALKFVKDGHAPRISIWTEVSSGAEISDLAMHGAPFSSAREVTQTVVVPAGQGNIPPSQAMTPRVRIIVRDEGIGIPPETHAKIFGIFERGTSSSKYQGSGIGLAIVARAIQRMGGACGVESQPGAGSRFWLELPEA